jgi:hypothetical protein
VIILKEIICLSLELLYIFKASILIWKPFLFYIYEEVIIMSEKNILSRVQHKHDIEANWIKAVNFIPKKAELIVYDPDENFDYSRTKIGDGIKNVNDLPFIIDITTDDEIIEMLTQLDMLPSIVDFDGALLSDENGDILLW